jgi:hypothetical protein
MAPVYLIEQLRMCVSADDGYIYNKKKERKMYICLTLYRLRNAPNGMFERDPADAVPYKNGISYKYIGQRQAQHYMGREFSLVQHVVVQIRKYDTHTHTHIIVYLKYESLIFYKKYYTLCNILVYYSSVISLFGSHI